MLYILSVDLCTALVDSSALIAFKCITLSIFALLKSQYLLVCTSKKQSEHLLMHKPKGQNRKSIMFSKIYIYFFKHPNIKDYISLLVRDFACFRKIYHNKSLNHTTNGPLHNMIEGGKLLH